MKKITDCLNPILSKIFHQVEELRDLNDKVMPILPKDIQPHCHLSRIENGYLTLSVNQPAIASQLRFMLPDLRDQLRKKGLFKLSAIRVVVDVNAHPEIQSHEKPKLTLSNKAREIIEAESQVITDDGLRQAFERLKR